MNEQSLLRQLTQFGLDGRDWLLVRATSRDYLIRSRQDSDVVLRGRIRRRAHRPPTWASIDLVSI